jgi:hypothetical protein
MKKLLLILLCVPLIGLGQNVYIPDSNFKAYLVGNSAINTNGDAEIQVSEANIFSDSITFDWPTTSDLTGIEAFTALTYLDCSNTQLTSLDVSQNAALYYLGCRNNQLTSLNVSNNTALTNLRCYNNQLTTLDVSTNTALTELACGSNQLTSLDVSNNIYLAELACGSNQLTSLDVSNNIYLAELACENNYLTSLDVSTNTALSELWCENNYLTSLDVSTNTVLIYLDCPYNQLTSLDLSGAIALVDVDCAGNLLECLDISNNINLYYLTCSDNLLEQLNTRNGNWVNGMAVYANTNNLTCVEVDNIGYATSNWQSTFDSFVTFSANCNYTNPCTTVSAIEEQTTNKELLKVTDILGREVNEKRNTPLFYIYKDGTVEKKIIIE